MSEPPRKRAKVKVEGKEVERKPVLGQNAAGASNDQDFMTKLTNSRIGCASSILQFKFNKKRVRVISECEDFRDDHDGVVYWMSRDQRVQDNWAFLYAQKLALQLEVPLHVCFCLVPKFLDATIRHFRFMLKGLREVEQECKSLGISFHLLTGYASKVLPKFVRDHNIGGVVTDFSPLRGPRKWVEDVGEGLPDDVPLCQVDAHNIVPCWIASPKLEYGARTIRKKIHDQLPLFLTEFPPVIKHKYLPKSKPEPTDWDAADASLEVDMAVGEVDWATPGSNSGLLELDEFCKKRLKFFAAERNNPNKAVASNLSPWIHFGQISVQRCILIVKQFKGKFKESVDSYIEEAIIRRELSDNFCYYNKNYDSIEGAYDWAKTSLQIHAKDKREKIYTQKQFEEAKTHDDLWNAAQIQLVKEGKMHGFLRMYWAKKILEWTPTPEEALRIAIYLNDRFSLDGRDPNGFVGCAWSICGIHDQGWAERAVFGKIRYMNYKGCQRKFKVDEFVKKYGAKKY